MKANCYVKNITDAQLYDIMPPISESVITYIYKNIINETNILADIGSGTGRLTKELLKHGNQVYAVEPDESMRMVCKNNLGKYDNLKIINATAEKTKLKNKSIDYFLISQSLHRFNIIKFKNECNRVLKNNKNVIVIWNRIHFDKPIFKDLLNALKQSYPNYKSRYDNKDEVKSSKQEIIDNTESVKKLLENNTKVMIFENNYEVNKEVFVDLVLSLGLFPLYDNSNNSELLNNGEIDTNKFIKLINNIFNKYQTNNLVTLPFETDIHFCKED